MGCRCLAGVLCLWDMLLLVCPCPSCSPCRAIAASGRRACCWALGARRPRRSCRRWPFPLRCAPAVAVVLPHRLVCLAVRLLCPALPRSLPRPLFSPLLLLSWFSCLRSFRRSGRCRLPLWGWPLLRCRLVPRGRLLVLFSRGAFPWCVCFLPSFLALLLTRRSMLLSGCVGAG